MVRTERATLLAVWSKGYGMPGTAHDTASIFKGRLQQYSITQNEGAKTKRRCQNQRTRLGNMLARSFERDRSEIGQGVEGGWHWVWLYIPSWCNFVQNHNSKSNFLKEKRDYPYFLPPAVGSYARYWTHECRTNVSKLDELDVHPARCICVRYGQILGIVISSLEYFSEDIFLTMLLSSCHRQFTATVRFA